MVLRVVLAETDVARLRRCSIGQKRGGFQAVSELLAARAVACSPPGARRYVVELTGREMRQFVRARGRRGDVGGWQAALGRLPATLVLENGERVSEWARIADHFEPTPQAGLF